MELSSYCLSRNDDIGLGTTRTPNVSIMWLLTLRSDALNFFVDGG
jgi:hypothetical protein